MDFIILNYSQTQGLSYELILWRAKVLMYVFVGEVKVFKGTKEQQNFEAFSPSVVNTKQGLDQERERTTAGREFCILKIYILSRY